MAKLALNLCNFYVRKNAVILKCDLTIDMCQITNCDRIWLKFYAKSYERTEMEVSRILKKPWSMLSDRVFKLIKLDEIIRNLHPRR